jgi:hypothetical protein
MLQIGRGLGVRRIVAAWRKRPRGYSLPAAIEVTLNRALRADWMKLALHFRGLGKRARYQLIRYDDSQFLACLADPERPGPYILQYLAGDVGLHLFAEIAEQEGLRPLESDFAIPHLPLLKLMAFPAFYKQ